MFAIFQKEINSFFNSPIAYIVISIFLVAMGLFSWIFPNNILESGFASLDALFWISPFVYMFLIPAITMRTFAEEKQTGTIELLFTNPISDWHIVISKYLASWILVLFSLVPTLFYYYSVYDLGNPQGNIDSAAVAGSYIGLLLLGGVFVAIGIFASAITNSQISSFVVAVFLCFILYTGFSSLSNINIWNEYAYFIGKIGIDFHYEALSKGLIDIRNVLYFFSITAIFLYLTKLVLQSRKW